MNKHKFIALLILFLALALDVFTYLFFLAPSANAHAESNPFKVLFGADIMLLLVIPISLLVVFMVKWMLDNKVKTKFDRDIVYLVLANIVFSKVLASIANVIVSVDKPQPIQTNEFLLFSYILTMIIMLVSPLVLNLGFYYLSHLEEQVLLKQSSKEAKE